MEEAKSIFYREGAKMRRIQIKKRFLVQFPDLLRVLRVFAVRKHLAFSSNRRKTAMQTPRCAAETISDAGKSEGPRPVGNDSLASSLDA
jgi:hypothetical protein